MYCPSTGILNWPCTWHHLWCEALDRHLLSLSSFWCCNRAGKQIRHETLYLCNCSCPFVLFPTLKFSTPLQAGVYLDGYSSWVYSLDLVIFGVTFLGRQDVPLWFLDITSRINGWDSGWNYRIPHEKKVALTYLRFLEPVSSNSTITVHQFLSPPPSQTTWRQDQ